MPRFSESLQLDAGLAFVQRSMDEQALIATRCKAAMGGDEQWSRATNVETGDDRQQTHRTESEYSLADYRTIGPPVA
jgi:hypothetical protein